MSAAERFSTHPPASLHWHPANCEAQAEDPQTFRLHLEFVHAHGLPAGQFTTFSIAPAGHDDRDGARGK